MQLQKEVNLTQNSQAVAKLSVLPLIYHLSYFLAAIFDFFSHGFFW